ncbi:MAG: YggS family pyridoxal phosphate-dependent enzyme [Deltaproteobacteria bacterium]|nr:YggS family pyridoxal phosphate-dependent enzyme [Deltaproteobacteria bacterium]TLN05110.1 MAG: YggS family pyridoxal phosphate-dependent enzyme [bacterium]
MSIAENLKHIQDSIISAAQRSGRNADSVKLVAVSKTQPTEAVKAALEAGQQFFGENYVQEFLEKAQKLPESVEWHFIGSLQSNKVKYLAGLTRLIHSVDRLSLAQEIDRQWGKVDKVCDILLQVNISGETTKSGTSAEELFQLAREVALLPHLRVKGLMTMPPFFDEPERARPYFRELKKLSGLLAAEKIPGITMEELSMGMSGDFEVAIEEGATLVRVGSAIFGERYYP